MRHLNRIVVHHSASPLSTTRDEIDTWHRAKGWDGVGYHFVIEGDGTIRVGRPLDTPGAHARGHNADSVGICVVGNNQVAQYRWTGPQVDALRRLVHGLCTVFPTIRFVSGHGHLAGSATACPGLTLTQLEEMLNITGRDVYGRADGADPGLTP